MSDTSVPTMADIQQAKLDMDDINTFVGSNDDQFTDNGGTDRLTLAGIINTAIINAGYIDRGTFSAGATLTAPNEVLQYSGEFYRWSGTFPKAVTAGSTPTPSGVGNWLAVGDATLRAALASVGSTALIAGVQAGKLGYLFQNTYAVSPKNIFDKKELAVGYSISGDPSAWDWADAIQSAMDEGGCWFFPPFNKNGTSFYEISKTLQLRVNKSFAMFSQYGSARRVYIKCKAGFTGKSLFRQWDSTWYGVGETDQDQRPVDLTAYSALVDRYLNIHHMGFYVSSGVTALDLVSLQETSQLNDLVFNGDNGITKGYPIRVRSGGGNEISFNGTAWKNITVYSNQWKGMVLATGAGSDIDIENFVTAPAACENSPFEFDVIDVTIRNLHCEAFSTGKPTVLNKGTDLRITDSFFVIKDGQGDVVKCENPFGGGYSRTGAILTSVRLYPVGGNNSAVTNRNSIKLINDTSQAKQISIPISFNSEIATMVVSASKSGYSMVKDGNVYEQSFSDGVKSALIRYAPSGGNETTHVIAGTVITLTHEALKSMMVRIEWQAGSVYQAAGNDYFNNAQWGRIGLGSSYNGSEYQKSAQIITDKAPAIFGSPVWDRTTGTLQLTVLVSFTYGLFMIDYI